MLILGLRHHGILGYNVFIVIHNVSSTTFSPTKSVSVALKLRRIFYLRMMNDLYTVLLWHKFTVFFLASTERRDHWVSGSGPSRGVHFCISAGTRCFFYIRFEGCAWLLITKACRWGLLIHTHLLEVLDPIGDSLLHFLGVWGVDPVQEGTWSGSLKSTTLTIDKAVTIMVRLRSNVKWIHFGVSS